MPKFSFDNYQVDVEATDKQGGFSPLPYGHYRIWAEAIDFPKTKDEKGHQAAVVFEVQEPENYKGRKFREWWTMLHSEGNNNKAYAFGKGKFDKFCRAVDVMPTADTDYDDFLFKTFVVRVGINEFNDKINNQIEHFYYEDDGAKEEIPELGVIGDGTQPGKAARPAAANNNQPPAANDNKAAAPAAAAGGKRPWGARK